MLSEEDGQEQDRFSLKSKPALVAEKEGTVPGWRSARSSVVAVGSFLINRIL